MFLVNKRYFFINNFYFKVLNFTYLFFMNNNLKQFSSLDYVELKSNDLKKLNINKSIFVNKDLKVLYLNFFDIKYKLINLKNVDFISFYGFFIGNKFKNNFVHYSLFYKNNYKLFIVMIHIYINIIRYLLFCIMFKIIYILNFLKIKKLN